MNYDELESQVLRAIENRSPFVDSANPEFNQEVVPSKQLLGRGIGGGISGIASGFVTRFSPIDLTQFGIAGIVPIVTGTLGKLILKPKNMLEDVLNGMIVAGISEAVSGFTGGIGVSAAQKREKDPKEKIEQTQQNRGVNAIW